MSNPYKRLLGLLPSNRQDVGTVLAVHDDGVTVGLISGAQVRVRGGGAIGDAVFIQGGAVIGPAPTLSGTDQEV